MARLPSKLDLSGPVSMNSGRAIASADVSAISRGLQSFGQDVAQVGDDLAKQKTTAETSEAELMRVRSQIDQGNAFANDTDFGTLRQRADEESRKSTQAIASTITDPTVRAKWLANAEEDRLGFVDQIGDRGVQGERSTLRARTDTSIARSFDMMVDPTTPEPVRAKLRSDIEGSVQMAEQTGLYDPEVAAAMREKYLVGGDQQLALNTANLEKETDPEGLVGRLGIPGTRDGYFAAIRASESGGNDTAANPLSSAKGRYQFTSGTWGDMVRNHPDAGLSPGGVLDPAQQEIAIRLLTQDNANVLAGAGIDDSNANLYAAHFLGAGGAVAALKATDGTSMQSVVDQAVIKANPFLANMTVGDFKAWTAKKSGGGAAAAGPSPEFANLPFSARLQIFDQANAEIASKQAAAKAQATATYTMHHDAVDLGIANNEIVSTETVLSDPNLNDGDKAKFVRAIETEQKATAGARAFNADPYVINTFDADQRALAEKAYGDQQSHLPEDERGAAANAFIKTTGYVPKAIVATVRQNLASTDPQAIIAGMSQAVTLHNTLPTGLAGLESGAEIQKAADLFETYSGMGYSADEIAGKVIASNDPQAVRERDALLKSKPIADLLKGVSDRDISQMFPALPLMGLQVGEDTQQSTAMVSEYRSILEESIVDARGDVDAAKALASTRFQRRYGPSSLSLAGEHVITRLPPEKTYPALPDGSHGYIKSQLEEALQAENVSFTDVRLQPYVATDDDFAGGQPARYHIFYKPPGSSQFELFNLPFIADYPSAMEDYKAGQGQLLVDAETRRRQNIETIQAAPGQEQVRVLMEQLYGADPNAVP